MNSQSAFSVALRLIVSSIAAFQCTESITAADRVLTGHELFVREWSFDEGLGPVFNASSCLACHFQGGIGGGGPNDRNVHLLTLSPPVIRADADRKRFIEKARAVHPDFSKSTPTIVLHRFNIDPTYDLWRFGVLNIPWPKRLNDAMRAKFLRTKESHLLQTPLAHVKRHGVTMIFSQRNTPALFGAGILDDVPVELLQNIAQQQTKSQNGISGRFTGKFGWRGQTPTLKDFVLGACANELGLQTVRHKAPTDPLCSDETLVRDELTEFECHKLVQLVASLPAPRRSIPQSAQDKAIVNNGERLFHTIGCVECHVQNLGDVTDVYSDLLVHDMGPSLSDPVSAPPIMRKVGEVTAPGSGYFGGGTTDVFDTIAGSGVMEWKTPPLWGCAASAPYLHDGRAGTLHESIMLHGGEATVSRNRYAALDTLSKQRVVSFLQSLAPPGHHELPTE